MTFGIARGAAVDAAGNLQDHVWVEVRRMVPGFPIAVPIYADSAGNTALDNPFMSDTGEFEFYAVGGTYRVHVYKTGFDKTWDDVPIGTAQGSDVDAYASAGFTWAPESSTSTPPSDGCIRFDNADVSLAGHIYVSKDTLGNSDVTNWLSSIVQDGWLLLSTGVGIEVGWPVVSVTDNTTWLDIRVLTSSYSGPAGPISFGDSGFVTMAQERRGLDGTGAFTRVRAVATSNITISTALDNGDVIDGVTLATNDLVLVAGQTDATQNGVYVVGATPARDTSFNTYDAHPGAYFSVMEGTTYADTLWHCTSDKGGTLGTDDLDFRMTSGPALYLSDVNAYTTNSWMPNFGAVPLHVVSANAGGGNVSALIGSVRNTAAANTSAFPTGTTGYGRVDNGGNQVFGGFFRADQYDTGVAVGGEVNSFNFFGAPSSNLPPDKSIGTTQTQPTALQVAAGGSYNSAIGIHIDQEGSSPQSFLTAIYVAPKAAVTYGLFIDATTTDGPAVPAQVSHKVANVAMQLRGKGAPVAANAWLTYTDGNGVVQFALKQAGQVLAGDGSAAAPSLGFVNDEDSGLYRIGANNIGLALGGSKVLDVASTGLTITGLSTADAFTPAGSTVPANGMYLPASNTLGWAINSAAELQLTASAFSPAANDGNALGTAALGWADAFFASGAVINFANGDYTLTHSSGLLTASGGFTAGGAGSFTTSGSLATTLQVVSTSADDLQGPIVQFLRNSASPAAFDQMGAFFFAGKNASGSGVNYASLISQIVSPTAAAESGRLFFRAYTSGSENVEMTIGGGINVGTSAAVNGNGTLTVDTAIYKGSNKVVGARDTGWTAMTGTPDKATAYATSTVTLAQLAGRVAQLQASLTTHGLIGA